MSDGIRFRATIELGGKTATGIPVPDEVVAALAAGRRPAVRVTVAAHTYRTTIASMGGRFMIPLSAEHRAHAGVAAGDEVEVHIESDTAARDVTLPSDLAEALREDGPAQSFFESLAYTHRKEWIRWIEEAKKPDTRANRIETTVEALRAGKRNRQK
jgi:Bacteriocin-protection, YdeI or OmpD-Associated/Domain of unknown function (DUF1905)